MPTPAIQTQFQKFSHAGRAVRQATLATAGLSFPARLVVSALPASFWLLLIRIVTAIVQQLLGTDAPVFNSNAESQAIAKAIQETAE